MRAWRDRRRIRRTMRVPLTINGMKPAEFIKRAYDLGPKLDGPGRFDMKDPIQKELRLIRDWIKMAEHDALESRRESQRSA